MSTSHLDPTSDYPTFFSSQGKKTSTDVVSRFKAVLTQLTSLVLMLVTIHANNVALVQIMHEYLEALANNKSTQPAEIVVDGYAPWVRAELDCFPPTEIKRRTDYESYGSYHRDKAIADYPVPFGHPDTDIASPRQYQRLYASFYLSDLSSSPRPHHAIIRKAFEHLDPCLDDRRYMDPAAYDPPLGMSAARAKHYIESLEQGTRVFNYWSDLKPLAEFTLLGRAADSMVRPFACMAEVNEFNS